MRTTDSIPTHCITLLLLLLREKLCIVSFWDKSCKVDSFCEKSSEIVVLAKDLEKRGVL